MISVDAYPFLTFLDLTCHLEIVGFLVALCHLIVKRPKLGSSNQEAYPSASKNAGVVLVPCSHMEVRHYRYSWWCKYFRGIWVSFVMMDEFTVRATKISSGIGVS